MDDQMLGVYGDHNMPMPLVIQTYIKSFTRAGVETWMATFGPDATYCDPAIIQPTPMRDLREVFLGFFAGLPDATTETTAIDPISDNLWVWRWVIRGTNSGPYHGEPPTGRAITIEGCEFIEVKDGQIHTVRGYFDRLSILTQLGRFPDPPGR